MRIDKFLKVSRLSKRRETAKELCLDGDILINGKKAKAMSEVNVGDKLVIKLGRHTIEAEVLSIKPFANKETASTMYRVISDETSERS